MIFIKLGQNVLQADISKSLERHKDSWGFGNIQVPDKTEDLCCHEFHRGITGVDFSHGSGLSVDGKMGRLFFLCFYTLKHFVLHICCMKSAI